MINYTVIATYTYPSELIVVRSLLESNGIECYVRDELTVQVHNFYSNAIGGIRMEIPNDQIDLAKQLMIENGFQNYLCLSDDEDLVNSKRRMLSALKVGIIFSIVATVVLFLVLFGFSQNE